MTELLTWRKTNWHIIATFADRKNFLKELLMKALSKAQSAIWQYNIMNLGMYIVDFFVKNYVKIVKSKKKSDWENDDKKIGTNDLYD